MLYIATAWKSPINSAHIKEMLAAGVDIFRINCSHDPDEQIVAAAKELQTVVAENNGQAALLLDLPQQKVRLGKIPERKQTVTNTETHQFRTGDTTESINNFIPLQLSDLDTYFTAGDNAIIGDGELEFIIEKVTPTELTGHFKQSGELCQYRSVFTPQLMDKLDHVKPVFDTLDLYASVRPEYIALSFVNQAETVTKVRAEIAKRFGDSWQPKIMAKIESRAGLNNLAAIADAADLLIVARGDLALTIDYAEIILAQKQMCKTGRERNCPVIVATQILDSLLHASLPSRGDLADVTNIVLDGASGMWFSQATAHSEHPGQTILTARHIVETVEKSIKL